MPCKTGEKYTVMNLWIIGRNLGLIWIGYTLINLSYFLTWLFFIILFSCKAFHEAYKNHRSL